MTFIVGFGLFAIGAVLFVRGLSSVAKARAGWAAHGKATTASVVSCRRVESDPAHSAVTIEYRDLHEQAKTATLPPAYREFSVGERVSIRYDPSQPSSEPLDHDFRGSEKLSLILFFGAAMMVFGLVAMGR